MKKYLTFILLSIAVTASANTDDESQKLTYLKHVSPNAHDVVIEINTRLKEKCKTALKIEQIVNSETLFVFLMAMRSVDENAASTESYLSALDGIECKNISAGLPKK